jgi:PKD repeat protein
VTLFPWRLLSTVVLATFLGGCGGCQPGSAPDDVGGAAARKAAGGATAAAGAAATPTKAAVSAGGLPTAKSMATIGRPPAAGGEMQGEQAVEPAPAEEPEEADCSVIADAEPDYGEPPLNVHFSVDYECTEGSATVSWDFGDNSGSSSDDNPTHTYRETGEYTAVVTVTTADGASATDEIDVTVESEDGGVPDVEPENP